MPDNVAPQSLNPERDAEIQIAIERMFLKHKASLLRMIAKKLTSKMGARICPEDVLSESMEAALKQLRNGTSAPKVSELIWLRLIVNQQIQTVYRRERDAKKRSIDAEVSIQEMGRSSNDSSIISEILAGGVSTPSSIARRNERDVKLHECLNQLSRDDFEILWLRQFEQLSNAEAAKELGLTPEVASSRHARALRKLTDVLKREKVDELMENS